MEDGSDFEIVEEGSERLEEISDINYGDFNLTLSFKDILALLDGKVLTTDINCEYAIYLRINKIEKILEDNLSKEEKEMLNDIRKKLGKENI